MRATVGHLGEPPGFVPIGFCVLMTVPVLTGNRLHLYKWMRSSAAGKCTSVEIAEKNSQVGAMFKRSLGLDAIRLVACVMVVVFHASVTASRPNYFGPQAHDWLFELENIRMPLFFALSGYLMSVLYLSRVSGAAHARDFLSKRLKKIFPLYWIALGVMCVATLIYLGGLPFDGPGTLIKTLLLLPQDPHVVGGTGAPIVYPAWVLQYEMVAYGLVALSLASRLFWGAFLWFWPWVHLLTSGSDVWLLTFFGSHWLLIFWFGVVLGQYLAGAQVHRSAALLWAVTWFGLASVARHFGYIDAGTEEIAYGLAFCGVILAVKSFSYQDASQWIGKVVRRGSDASYATFLFHIAVVSVACRLVRGMGLDGAAGHLTSIGLCLVVSLTLGLWINRHIEPRIAQWLERPGRAQDASTAAST